MPLSEHEQRILAEIERRLLEEDPKFAQQVGSSFRAHLARRMRLAVAAFLLGLVVVIFGFTQNPYLALAGAAIMVGSILVFARTLRRRAAAERPRPESGARAEQPPPTSRRQSLDSWWSRLNERWRQRWEERGGGSPPER
ncbi:MAG TPA: DUF3040 domain-containing protein [Actinomycetes bacterium]|nr:DUF3040 domain-containing protein [Actinomycetes bacterium]